MAENSPKVIEKVTENTPKVAEKISKVMERAKSMSDKLSENRITILKLMIENPYITRAELAKAVGVSENSIWRNIEAMRGKSSPYRSRQGRFLGSVILKIEMNIGSETNEPYVQKNIQIRATRMLHGFECFNNSLLMLDILKGAFLTHLILHSKSLYSTRFSLRGESFGTISKVNRESQLSNSGE